MMLWYPPLNRYWHTIMKHFYHIPFSPCVGEWCAIEGGHCWCPFVFFTAPLWWVTYVRALLSTREIHAVNMSTFFLSPSTIRRTSAFASAFALAFASAFASAFALPTVSDVRRAPIFNSLFSVVSRGTKIWNANQFAGRRSVYHATSNAELSLLLLVHHTRRAEAPFLMPPPTYLCFVTTNTAWFLVFVAITEWSSGWVPSNEYLFKNIICFGSPFYLFLLRQAVIDLRGSPP